MMDDDDDDDRDLDAHSRGFFPAQDVEAPISCLDETSNM